MSSHYYVKEVTTPSKERLISYKINGTSFSLLSDTNVFAKNGIDYGSATLLKVILPLIDAGKVLDIGCGYGVIGLTLASLIPDILVTCADINMRAVSLSNKNARALELSERVTVLQSDLYENIEGKFDYIVSNPPIRAGKKILNRIYVEALDHLNSNGVLYLVVRKKQGAESTVSFLENHYQEVTVLKKDKGYWIIKAVK